MKIWYTIEKTTNGYTIWKNKESEYGYGSSNVETFKTRKECVEYAKNNNIKIRRNRIKIKSSKRKN